MLWLADQGLPPRFQCLEIGSSAGIKLMLDRYHYDLAGVQVGPQPGVIAFTTDWRGPHPPHTRTSFDSVRGCAVAPVHVSYPAPPLRAPAYICPATPERLPHETL